MNIDSFLYRAALIQCETELGLLTVEVYHIQRHQILFLQGEASEEDIIPPLHKSVEIQQTILRRQKMCIEENLRYESRMGLKELLTTDFSVDGVNFSVLAERVEDLELILEEIAWRTKAKPMSVTVDESDEEEDTIERRQASGLSSLLFGVALICVPVICGVMIARVGGGKKGLLSWLSRGK